MVIARRLSRSTHESQQSIGHGEDANVDRPKVTSEMNRLNAGPYVQSCRLQVLTDHRNNCPHSQNLLPQLV